VRVVYCILPAVSHALTGSVVVVMVGGVVIIIYLYLLYLLYLCSQG